MAGGGRPQHNNKKRVNNYFTQNIQQYGENFLQLKNARELEMDAIKVFRNLARENVDLNSHGHYFLNQDFLNACLTAAYSKWTYFTISFNGVNCLVDSILKQGQTPDPNILTILDHHRKSAEAYNIIYNGLINIQNSNSVSYLVVLVNSVSPFRAYV